MNGPLPAGARSTARLFNRVRWVRKTHVARTGGGEVDARTRLGFILLDAETDTYSYELADPGLVARAVAEVLAADPDQVIGYAHELLSDVELARTLRARTIWRPQYKWQPPVGRHVVAYCVLRTLRPAQSVELGVRHGLGTVVMLRALERNAQEDSPGFLLSVDSDPSAAGLVRRQGNWRFVVGRTPQALIDDLLEAPIGFAISDTTPEAAVTRAEFAFVLANRADRVALLQNGSWNTVLHDLALRNGWPFREVDERSRGHVVRGRILHIASSGVGDAH
jgi:hypothetical protein